MMTDNFLQKFEEKVMTLLTELESSRKDLMLAKQEIANLKNEKANYTKKLQALVSLFDSLNVGEPNNVSELPVQDEYASA